MPISRTHNFHSIDHGSSSMSLHVLDTLDTLDK